ncbi:hypothetical protein [Lysinibacillus sp. BPa_S21]|uniref:hypothetical protein n=1 Tax=Lysinibacillus sp. BPa_S21 TaxID=2932478 RepID=UPI002010C900|nr:hypothetical protein [Lysinibacillus sp. BPa_S21]MCL1694694.1 hypothetical protein [Lysinibacillus sp. BPa_S21]
MDPIYKWILAILIAIVLIGIQSFLSRRTNVYWGAIVPILYLVFIFGWWFNGIENVTTYSLIKVAVVGSVFLLGTWAKGRESLKNKRKKELEKMKLYDIN